LRLAFVIIIIIIFLLLIFLFHLGSFPFLTTPAHLEGAEGIIQEGAAPHGHCLVQPWTSDQAEGNCEERKVLLAWPAEARQAAEQGNHPIVVSDTKHPSSEPLKIHSHPPLVFLFSFWVFLSREKIKNVFFFSSFFVHFLLFSSLLRFAVFGFVSFNDLGAIGAFGRIDGASVIGEPCARSSASLA